MKKKKIIYKFNNISKILNICIYKIYYISKNNKNIINYINKKYKFNKIFKKISLIINDNILNIYKKNKKLNNNNIKYKKYTINFSIIYLNNSHIYIYIYNYLKKNILNIKIDIEIYTYNLITPLKTIDYLISIFKPNLIIIDYKIRGYIKKKNKNKKINSIQKYISTKNKKIYDIFDINIYNENIFQTKMIIKKININKNIINLKKKKYNKKKKIYIIKLIWKKIKKICY